MLRKLLKYLFYNVFCPGLLFLSADKILFSATRNKKLIIMYHGVRKGTQRINGRHISAAQFERQLRYFARNFDVVSLQEICEMKLRGVIPARNTIALTFDDGFLNNVSVALPLLRQYHMPATFFLCSAAIVDKSYIHPSDLLDLVRVAGGRDKIQIGNETFVRQDHGLISVTTRRNAYDYVSSQPLERWYTMVNNLKSELEFHKFPRGVDEELYALIDATSLKELAKDDLADIGSHCHHHVDLTQLQVEEVDRELELSKKILGTNTSKPVASIAFPFGYYNADVIERARSLGFKYLIAGGDVPAEFRQEVFPRIGVLDSGSFAHTILSTRRGFGRFGF